MPLAPVDEHGTQLFYEDSGVPENSTSYTTLVLIHGAIFYGAIYKRLFRFAAENNLRLVAVTLRDYPGSTPFSADEHAALRSSDREIQASMIRDRGKELATFLAWFIHQESIPPVSYLGDDVKPNKAVTGGLAILGWSWGNCMIISLVAHADSLPAKTMKDLEPYMRKMILYDPPFFVFGIAAPPLDDVYMLIQDPEIPRGRMSELFTGWISGYFDHDHSVLSSLPSLTYAEVTAGLTRNPIPDPPISMQPTIEQMSAAERAETADFSVFERSHVAMMEVDRSIYDENIRRVLSDSTTWPHLSVVHVWCDMSVPETVYAAWCMDQILAELGSTVKRRASVERFKGANHFHHWVQPQATLQDLATII